MGAGCMDVEMVLREGVLSKKRGVRRTRGKNSISSLHEKGISSERRPKKEDPVKKGGGIPPSDGAR